MDYFEVTQNKQKLNMGQFTEILEDLSGSESLSLLPLGVVFYQDYKNESDYFGVVEEKKRVLIMSENLEESNLINKLKNHNIKINKIRES